MDEASRARTTVMSGSSSGHRKTVGFSERIGGGTAGACSSADMPSP